jgi:multidrug efflux pump subunit AcrA (membrane-fusion protein)
MLKRPSLYLSIAGVVAAILLVIRLQKVPQGPPPLVEPPSAPFAESIGARGIVESVDENVRVAPAVAGLVEKVLVKVGDRVQPGQPLIEQDRRDASALVAAQEAQLLRLRALIREAEVREADRKEQWVRAEKLAESRVSSVDEKQRAFFAAQAASAQLESARAELHAAEAQLARLKVAVDLLTVVAPREGTVLQVNVRAGEYAAPNTQEPLILLGRVDRFQLRADVDEDNASKVRPGCTGVAFIKGIREKPIPLEFVRIEPYVVPKRSLTGESNERVDTRVLQIIFRFEHSALPVYVGQQMDVYIGVEGVRGEG